MLNTINPDNFYIPITPDTTSLNTTTSSHSTWYQKKVSPSFPQVRIKPHSRKINTYTEQQPKERIISVLAISDIAEVLGLSAELFLRANKAISGPPLLSYMALMALQLCRGAAAPVTASPATASPATSPESFGNTCKPGEFDCGFYGACIPKAEECNKILNCVNGADEHENCKFTTCSDSEFPCGDGQCIPHTKVCNFVNDCTSGKDEGRDGLVDCGWSLQNISLYRNCPPGKFACDDYGDMCIQEKYKCDGHVDCFYSNADEDPAMCRGWDDEDYFQEDSSGSGAGSGSGSGAGSGAGIEFTDTRLTLTTATAAFETPPFWHPRTVITSTSTGIVCTLLSILYLGGVTHGIIKGKRGCALLIHPFKLIYSTIQGSQRQNTTAPINIAVVDQHIYQCVDYEQINGQRLRIPPTLPPRDIMTSNDAGNPSTGTESSIITRTCQQQCTNTDNAAYPLLAIDTLLSPTYYQLNPDESERSDSDHHSGVLGDSIQNISVYSSSPSPVLTYKSACPSSSALSTFSAQPRPDAIELSDLEGSPSTSIELHPAIHCSNHHQPQQAMPTIMNGSVDISELQETRI